MKKISNLLETISTVNGFVILKPEFIKHEKEFLTLLNNSGWKVIQKKKGWLTQEQAEALYKQHKGKSFYNDLCKYMCSDECLCCSCHKECNDPIKEMTALKNRVRDQWGKSEMKNAMHSSDSLESVNREIGIVFNNNVVESIDDNSFEFDNQTLGAETVGYDGDAPEIKEMPKDIDDTYVSLFDLDPSSDENATPESIIFTDLKSLYCEEINAFYQYWVVKEFLAGPERANIQEKYSEYALDELTDHSAKLLKRMNELNIPVNDLLDLYRNDNNTVNKYIIPTYTFNTYESLLQNIDAESKAIEHYKMAIKHSEDIDPTTCQLLKNILADEESHLAELNDFIKDINNTQHNDI